ncbi:MAG: succinate dehydrogenase iron-sulfur subunit [Candidatus Sericytochromatia bacterium]|nr:succinate dehydrogenase iron-sulfur subunit [Candidatus Sericytochromatia bacterium]
MKVLLRIRRFDPAQPDLPAWATYDLELDPHSTLLDALHRIKAEQDSTVSFRRSCGMGICGSDAMQVNGRNRLACKVLMYTLGPVVTVEPLKGLAPLRDLVVDLDPFFANLKAVKPWLINDNPPPARERLQSPEERERYDDTTKCILCAACTTACPPFWNDPSFVGPAAIVNAHQYIYDSRDEGTAERMAALTGPKGIFRCRVVFNCTECCPRDIKITDAIEQLKRDALKGAP